jgi:hypothetical protein
VRKGQCFNTYDQTCVNPRIMLLTKDACCCTNAGAWGLNSTDCRKCPKPNDGRFKKLIKLLQKLLILIFKAEFLELCPYGYGYTKTDPTDPNTDSTKDIDECIIQPDICKNGKCKLSYTIKVNYFVKFYYFSRCQY